MRLFASEMRPFAPGLRPFAPGLRPFSRFFSLYTLSLPFALVKETSPLLVPTIVVITRYLAILSAYARPTPCPVLITRSLSYLPTPALGTENAMSDTVVTWRMR
eukprot:2983498-Rhodomonas_salina.1